LYVTATLPDKVEHINGDIADNRWINLDVNNEKQQETNWRNKMKIFFDLCRAHDSQNTPKKA
jgi:predicted CoA-binding protein